MIIISENELIHTDRFDDVIEHHGVKGMKWGQRMRGNYVVGAGSANRAQKRILRLQKRNQHTALNKAKDVAGAIGLAAVGLPSLIRSSNQKRFMRSTKIDKLKAKINSNKNNTTYKDEYSKIKDGYNKRSNPAKEAWKKSIAENGRSNINTKIAKLHYKSAKSKDRADEWRHKVGGKKTTTEEVMGYYNANKYAMKAKKLERKKMGGR